MCLALTIFRTLMTDNWHESKFHIHIFTDCQIINNSLTFQIYFYLLVVINVSIFTIYSLNLLFIYCFCIFYWWCYPATSRRIQACKVPVLQFCSPELKNKCFQNNDALIKYCSIVRKESSAASAPLRQIIC